MGPPRRLHHRPQGAPRAGARLALVMNGYDTDADGENNFYTVNGRTFYYARYPITAQEG